MKHYIIEHAGQVIAIFNNQDDADEFFIDYISGGYGEPTAEHPFTNEAYIQYFDWLEEHDWNYKALAEYHGYNIPINGVSDWLVEYEKEG